MDFSLSGMYAAALQCHRQAVGRQNLKAAITLYHSALPESKAGYWRSCEADNLRVRVLDERPDETAEEQSLGLEPQRSSDGTIHSSYLGPLISSEILNWCCLRPLVRVFLFKAPDRVTCICQHITAGRAVVSSIRS